MLYRVLTVFIHYICFSAWYGTGSYRISNVHKVLRSCGVVLSVHKSVQALSIGLDHRVSNQVDDSWISTDVHRFLPRHSALG